MNPQPAANIRLHGRWLVLAQVTWLGVTFLALALFVASLAPGFAHYHTICMDTVCDGRLSFERYHALRVWGLSLPFFATYFGVLNGVLALVHFVIALIIFARKSDNGLALFVALMLVTSGMPSGYFDPLLVIQPAWWLPAQFVRFIGDVSMMLFFYLFPTGQFVPRWTQVLALLWIGIRVPVYFFPDSPFNLNTWSRDPYNPWPLLFHNLVFMGFWGSGLFAQLYRYQRISSPVQRQQTKWVVFGVTLTQGGYIAMLLLLQMGPIRESDLLVWWTVDTAFPLFSLFIPLSIGVAILRSHLWEIDLIIRRTLIYSTLSATLALIYFGSVVLLQILLRILTGQGQSQFVTVLSTLAIAALFTPLRHRVQTGIDWRFYRHKYNAEQVLAAFSATVRDATDLAKVINPLVAVIQETLQPAQVSVWLQKTVVDEPRTATLGQFPALTARTKASS